MVVNSLKREVYSRYKPTKGGSNSSSSRSGLSVKRRNSVVSPRVGVKGARVFPFFACFLSCCFSLYDEFCYYKRRRECMFTMTVWQNNEGYSYLKFDDGRRTFNVWVNKRLLDKANGNVLKFPVQGARFVVKDTGTIILVPDDNCNAFVAGVRSGYRGYVKDFEVVSDGVEVVRFATMYRSPAGSLGETKYVLCNTGHDKVKVRGRQFGRGLDRDGEVVYVVQYLHGDWDEFRDDVDGFKNDLE